MHVKVKDLIKELKNFNEEYFVSLSGGEGMMGSWATLKICETEKDAIFDNGIVIMEDSEY